MDTILISLSIGLGLHKTIGYNKFVKLYLGVTGILPILLSFFLESDYLTEYKLYKNNIQAYRHSVTGPEVFDFIIVGGGASGCVIANRLSKKYKVLLIEAGGNPNPLTLVPGLESLMLSRKETDYKFLTTKQQYSCYSCNNRRAILNQGKGLGGSGMINSMVYQRGHPYDYDNWALLTKNKIWSYKSVLKYFLRSENYCFECGDYAPTNARYHGTTGELPIMKPYGVPLIKEFMDSMRWAGVKIRDTNAPYFSATANVASYNQKYSRRSSSYTSFIEPIIKSRKNLVIWRYTQVIRVLLKQKTAYAVQYERFGSIGIVKANKEIILSSGAINTPKILMLSGIGDEELLNEHNIPVIIQSPKVGRNLQDHVGTLVGPFLINKKSLIFERDVTYESVLNYLYNSTGPLTLPFPVANAFITSSKSIKSNYPDIQIGFAPSGVSNSLPESLSRIHNINLNVLEEFFNPVLGLDSFFFIVNYGRPRSRGYVRLNSNNYHDDPIINPNYYSNEVDMEVTVEGLMNACYLGENSPVFKRIGSRLSPIPFPGCENRVFKSKSYWECVARHFTLSFHHYVGTAGMGNRDDSVVDSRLRIFGGNRLRVADSSVMNTITSSNTHSVSIMIGEVASDLILNEWGEENSVKSDDDGGGDDDIMYIDGDREVIKEKFRVVLGDKKIIDKGKSSFRMGWDDPINWFRW